MPLAHSGLSWHDPLPQSQGQLKRGALGTPRQLVPTSRLAFIMESPFPVLLPLRNGPILASRLVSQERRSLVAERGGPCWLLARGRASCLAGSTVAANSGSILVEALAT